MRGWSLFAVIALLLPGCVSEDPEPASDLQIDDDPVVQEAVERAAEAEKTGTNGSLPLLVEVDGAMLREGAAELVVPAGSYAIMRLVFTADVWGEDEPWDGSASAMVGIAHRGGEGVGMQAFGFGRAFGGEAPIRPWIDFFNTPDEGWAGMSVGSACSGDCSIPEHEFAFLVGGPEEATVVRMGVVDDWSGIDDELFGRTPVPVRADAVTQDAFAGRAHRMVYLAQEYEDATGIMEVARDDGPGAATFTGVERTARFHAEADMTERGIWSASLFGWDAAGIEQWSYEAQAAEARHGAEHTWVHAPNSHLLTASGAFWPPMVRAQEIVDPGPMRFDAERVFTGQSDPSGLASFTYESASVGHAGIDVVGLYDWELRPVSPPDGTAFCNVSSSQPVPVCQGDRALASQVTTG